MSKNTVTEIMMEWNVLFDLWRTLTEKQERPSSFMMADWSLSEVAGVAQEIAKGFELLQRAEAAMK